MEASVSILPVTSLEIDNQDISTNTVLPPVCLLDTFTDLLLHSHSLTHSDTMYLCSLSGERMGYHGITCKVSTYPVL